MAKKSDTEQLTDLLNSEGAKKITEGIANLLNALGEHVKDADTSNDNITAFSYRLGNLWAWLYAALVLVVVIVIFFLKFYANLNDTVVGTLLGAIVGNLLPHPQSQNYGKTQRQQSS